MWNDGKYLLFRHIANLYYSDQQFALHTLPKLTLDDIVLTSYSKMKVIIQYLSNKRSMTQTVNPHTNAFYFLGTLVNT
jgi:hypothetical protein